MITAKQLAPAEIALKPVPGCRRFHRYLWRWRPVGGSAKAGGTVVLIDHPHRQIPHRAVGVHQAHDVQRQDQHQPHRPSSMPSSTLTKVCQQSFIRRSLASCAGRRLRTSSAATSDRSASSAMTLKMLACTLPQEHVEHRVQRGSAVGC